MRCTPDSTSVTLVESRLCWKVKSHRGIKKCLMKVLFTHKTDVMVGLWDSSEGSDSTQWSYGWRNIYLLIVSTDFCIFCTDCTLSPHQRPFFVPSGFIFTDRFNCVKTPLHCENCDNKATIQKVKKVWCTCCMCTVQLFANNIITWQQQTFWDYLSLLSGAHYY